MADWIDADLRLKSGVTITLQACGVAIQADAPGSAGSVYRVALLPATAAQAAEFSIALKRAQRHMDSVWRDMRRDEEAGKVTP